MLLYDAYAQRLGTAAVAQGRGARAGGSGMRTELAAKDVGRLASYLFIASGLLSALALPLPQLPGINRPAVLMVSAIAVTAGLIVYLIPWERWSKRATLTLLPIAFTIIALGNYFGSARSYSYSVFFVVAFVWIGVSHPQRTSLWFAPLAVLAYVAPIFLKQANATADAAAAALCIPVCMLVAEILAYVIAGQQRSRRIAQAVAGAAQRLGQHLNEHALCQGLVDEAREALESEHAILWQFDEDTRAITAGFGSGLSAEVTKALDLAVGTVAANFPNAVGNGEPLVIDDTSRSDVMTDVMKQFGVKSVLAIPVMARGTLTGALAVFQTSKTRRYSADDLSIAKGLAGQASVAFQNARLYEQTLTASRSDPLTGLGNRRAFRERLESEVERSRRYGRDLSLIVLDADSFKSVNDTFGHQGGDRVLGRLAELLQRNRRMEDGAYRIGGDEFALLLPETGLQGATVLAERLRRRIEHEAIGGERDIPITASIGVSAFGEHGINADDLFEKADAALYEVKASGGNAAMPAHHASANARLGVDIDQIMEERKLLPYYQPIFDIRTGNVMGFETFTRIDSELGYTPTPTLFRAAAASGRVVPFDRFCRRVAMSGVTGLSDGELVFLNVSPAALESDDFSPQEIVDLAHEAGVSPERMVIEITEYERTPRSKRLVMHLKACREAGLMVALDDFGAGGADFDLLAGMHFDYVKVDMSFVQGANGVDTRRRLLRGFATVAVETGAITIAEGIESLDDLRLVRDLGFVAAQGFFLREPSQALDHSPRPLRLMATSENPNA